MMDKNVEMVELEKVKDLNLFASALYESHKIGLDILKEGSIENYSKEEAEFGLKQLQASMEYIPASEKFMQNVKRTFKDPQANFTIQNYLTWHHIDSILITYFKNKERLEKLRKCAVTEIDNIFVDSLEKLVSNTDLTTDQLRYAYFVWTVPRLLRYLYFYNISEEKLRKDCEIISSGMYAMENMPIESLYALQLVTYNEDPMMHFMVQQVLGKRKSKYGAMPNKINEERYGNILYKGLTGQYKDLEKGDIKVRDIKSLDDEKEYFKDRRNAYNLLSFEGVKIKGGYINDKMVGVIGYSNGKILNIHVDGDYRFKGVSKKLIEAALEEEEILLIAPIGDALDYVKRMSKYDKNKNMGLITKETVKGKFKKKELPLGLKVTDYDGPVTDLVSDRFKDYFNKTYSVENVRTKVAVLKDEIVGYIAYDKKNKIIAVIEVDRKVSGMGIASKLLESVIDYNIWTADVGQSGVLFWFGRGIMKDGSVFVSTSKQRLRQYAKSNNIDIDFVPRMHML